MPVTIRPMTIPEYQYFRQWSIAHQAIELMEELQISADDALAEATRAIAEMLPDGLHTAHHHLMTIAESRSETVVGFIWTIHEYENGIKQSFICDFAIWQPHRRKGYGAAALRLAECHAAKAGCQESVLFVTERNTAATALYQKCGYRLLRRKDYGFYMIKPISPAQ